MRRLRVHVLVVAALIATLLSGCSDTHPLLRVFVSVPTEDHDDGDAWQTCSGIDEYADLTAGAPVVVSDQDATTVATATLNNIGPSDVPQWDTANGPGAPADLKFRLPGTGPEDWLEIFATMGSCTLMFEIEDLPRTDVYSFQVGQHPGGAYTGKELAGTGWNATLMID